MNYVRRLVEHLLRMTLNTLLVDQWKLGAKVVSVTLYTTFPLAIEQVRRTWKASVWVKA